MLQKTKTKRKSVATRSHVFAGCGRAQVVWSQTRETDEAEPQQQQQQQQEVEPRDGRTPFPFSPPALLSWLPLCLFSAGTFN